MPIINDKTTFDNPSELSAFYSQLSTRLLSKLAAEDEVRGEAARRTGVYTQVHEDSSTDSTKQFASAVEFRKRSTASKTANGAYFTKGDTFNSNGVEFRVDQDFLCKRDPAGSAFHCFFIGEMLGDGKYAKVYEAKKFQVNPLSYQLIENYDQHVIKVQQHCGCGESKIAACESHNSQIMLNKEYLIGKDVPHLKIEQPVLIENGGECTSYMVMRRSPGKELYQILRETKLTLEQRFQLTLEIYKALRVFSDLNIVHGDLKIENVMINWEEAGPKAQIIDCGLARKILGGQKKILSTGVLGGTPCYLPPEFLRRGDVEVSFASDLYSLTRILMLIWGGDDESYDDQKTDPKLEGYKKFLRKIDKMDNLFKKIPDKDQNDLSSKLIEMIKSLFRQGVDAVPEKRGTVQEAFVAFEAIYRDYNDLRQSHTARSQAMPADDSHNSAAAACAALGGPQRSQMELGQPPEHHAPPFAQLPDLPISPNNPPVTRQCVQ